MPFENVYLVSTRIKPIPRSEIEMAERTLGVALPQGYVDLLTTFGEGDYCDFVFVPPSQLQERTARIRQAFADHWSWDEWAPPGVTQILSQQQALESILLAPSNNGDELLYYPPRPDRLYVLPRHSDLIEALRPDLSDLCGWSLGPDHLPYFQPIHGRAIIEIGSEDTSLEIRDLMNHFRDQWPGSAFHLVLDKHGESDVIVFYLQAIGARIQIDKTPTQVNEDTVERRVYLRIAFDQEAEAQVVVFLNNLLPDHRAFARHYRAKD